MTFSRLFVIISCILLILVGGALGYSAKMFLRVGDMSHRLKLLNYDVRALEYRIFLLEDQEIRLNLGGKRNISFYGLGS
jgi:hypothetical protein